MNPTNTQEKTVKPEEKLYICRNAATCTHLPQCRHIIPHSKQDSCDYNPQAGYCAGAFCIPYVQAKPESKPEPKPEPTTPHICTCDKKDSQLEVILQSISDLAFSLVNHAPDPLFAAILKIRNDAETGLEILKSKEKKI